MMMRRPDGKVGVTVLIGAILAGTAFAVTLTISGGAFADASSASEQTAPVAGAAAPSQIAPGLAPGESYAKSNFPRNASGETYGSDAEAGSFAEQPDLIAVMGLHGRIGFIKKTEAWPVLHPTFRSPADAFAWSEQVRINPPAPLAVYDLDGKTQIDLFKLGISGLEARDRNGKVTQSFPEGP
jgi:hypothetical protein